MAPTAPRTVAQTPHVFLPIARGRALLRGIVWSLPAAVLAQAVYLVITSLDFQPSTITSRWVTYSIILALLPVALAAATSAWVAVRWLLLALWPARLGIAADADALTMHLGPFGKRHYPAAQLAVKYPFELIEDDDAGGGFEGYLPEEQQRAQFLPRITHAAATTPLNREMLRFTGLSEPAAALMLRPVLELWRGERS